MAEKFELLPRAGIHVEDGVVCQAGDVVESERPLDEMFRGKFRKYGEEAPKEPVNASSKVSKKKTSKKRQTAKTGDDVTSQFDNAEEVGVKVIKMAGGKFKVLDAEDDSPLVDNEDKPLSSLTQKKVNEVIASYFEEEEDDEE